MRPVFVSRPTYVLPEHRKGLNNFETLLRARDLEPHTVGVTDYASLSPLDEVIQLMEECVGAVILGFPQIEVRSGTLKGEEIQAPFCLGTEWNHIEGGLAYALKLPLLVISDDSVVRGIFEVGAGNIFSYSADFSSESWPSDDQISGAVTAWHRRL